MILKSLSRGKSDPLSLNPQKSLLRCLPLARAELTLQTSQDLAPKLLASIAK